MRSLFSARSRWECMLLSSGRPSRGLPPWESCEPYPPPSCGACPAPAAGALRRASPCAGALRRVRPPAGAAGGCQGARSRAGGAKVLVNFLLCCRCCQALLHIFSSSHSLGSVSHRPEPSGGFFGAQTSRLQCSSTRADADTINTGCNFPTTRDERDNRRLTMGQSESSPPLLDG